MKERKEYIRRKDKNTILLILFVSFMLILLSLFSVTVKAEGYVNYKKYHDSFATKFNDFYIDKIRYLPGDTIMGSFDLAVDTSQVTRPMTNASVEVEIFYIANDEHGDYPIYHIMARFFLSKCNVSLLPYYTKHYSFEWTIPKHAPAGQYYIALTSQMGSFDIGGHSEVQGLEGAQRYFTVVRNVTKEDYARFDVYNLTVNNLLYNPGTFTPEFEADSPIEVKVPIENFGTAKKVRVKYHLYIDSKEKGMRLEDFVKRGIINSQNYPTLYEKIVSCKSHSGTKYFFFNSERGKDYFNLNLGKLKPGFYVLNLELEPLKSDEPNESLIIKIPIHGLQGRVLFQTLDHFPIKKDDKVMIGVGFGNPTTTSALLSSSLAPGQTYSGMLEDLATSFKNKEVIRITLSSNGEVIFRKDLPVIVTPLFEAVDTGFIARQDIKNAELKVELINKESVDDVEILDYDCSNFETNTTKLKLNAYYNFKRQDLMIDVKTEDNFCKKNSLISLIVKTKSGEFVYADKFITKEKLLDLHLKPDDYLITAIYKNQTVKKEINALSKQEAGIKKENSVILLTYVLMWLLIILIIIFVIIEIRKKFINKQQ